MDHCQRRVSLNRCLRISRALTCVFCLCISSSVAGQTGSIAPGKRQQLEAAIRKFMAANSIPGVSVAVVENGVEDWSAGFGSADLENSVPATAHTLYRLASISKSLTASGAMLLWQQGKLDLDAPVQKYCPAFPQKDTTITTRELLGHLGGIRHYKDRRAGRSRRRQHKALSEPDPGRLGFLQERSASRQAGY